MPTYEFRCPQGHEFEKLYRTISGAEAKASCPDCGQPAERVMSAAGFAFKGSGFYLTDYGKNAHRDKGTPEVKGDGPAGAGSAGEKSAETKSDAAPAAPAAPAAAAAPSGDSKKSEPKPADPKPASAPVKKSSAE